MSDTCFLTLAGEDGTRLFDGSVTEPGFEGTIRIHSVEHLIELPRGAGGGYVGPGHHGPFIATKYVDRATPYLATAMANGIRIPNVILHFRPPEDEDEQPSFVLVLENVFLCLFRHWTLNPYVPTLDADAGNPGDHELGNMEDIGFSYRSMRWFHPPTQDEANFAVIGAPNAHG